MNSPPATGIGPTPQASMKRPEGSLHAEPHGQWMICPVLCQRASWTAVFASLGSVDRVPCAASKFTTLTSPVVNVATVGKLWISCSMDFDKTSSPYTTCTRRIMLKAWVGFNARITTCTSTPSTSSEPDIDENKLFRAFQHQCFWDSQPQFHQPCFLLWGSPHTRGFNSSCLNGFLRFSSQVPNKFLLSLLIPSTSPASFNRTVARDPERQFQTVAPANVVTVIASM
mmetsp:Transcript_118044/g.235147  ORF Transcript_118044/g.235147 Transcript_118044/m.235147 type:complete len:227 (-) Transcript_118044:2009-2689(-)